MTVAELLQRLQAAYPALTAGALASWGPVFQKRLGKREGPSLHDAYTDTVAEFQPTVRKPFPIPADFEKNMPGAGVPHDAADLARWGPPIRAKAEARAKAIPLLVDAWKQRQGLKIEEARGWRVADACALEVQGLAGRRAWADRPADILLTAAQIQICEDRVVSTERVQRFGPIPKKADVWRAQMDESRAAVKSGARPLRPATLWKPEHREAAE